MKKLVIFSIVGLLAVAALIFGYRQMGKDRAADSKDDTPVTAKSRVEAATNGETILNLDEKTQKLIGLQTAILSPTTLPREIKGYGHVLDSSSLVQLLSAIASARASLDASSKEYRRVKDLFDQGENASARNLQTSEAAMKRDQITLRAAEAQLASAWGTSIARLPDLQALAESLSTLRLAVVRLDLPAGELTAETPSAARLILPDARAMLPAGFLGRATVTDPQVQGQGFLFVATNDPPQLSAGLALTGFMQMPGPALSGAIVPESAVVRDAGKAWAYAQTDATHFARRLIDNEHAFPNGWFVTHGWQPQDKVVIIGAQTLLSEEHKSEIKVED